MSCDICQNDSGYINVPPYISQLQDEFIHTICYDCSNAIVKHNAGNFNNPVEVTSQDLANVLQNMNYEKASRVVYNADLGCMDVDVKVAVEDCIKELCDKIFSQYCNFELDQLIERNKANAFSNVQITEDLIEKIRYDSIK